MELLRPGLTVILLSCDLAMLGALTAEPLLTLCCSVNNFNETFSEVHPSLHLHIAPATQCHARNLVGLPKYVDDIVRKPPDGW
jgi:hypothetical protein